LVTVEDLRRKFGKRMETVERWLMEDRVSDYVVDVDGEVSCIVKGEEDEYSTVINSDGVFSCSCWGFRSHQNPCKHVVFLFLYSWVRGDLSKKAIDLFFERW